MALVTFLPAAEKDLLEQADYYDAQSGAALADRFIASCEAGFERLTTFPESGTALRLRHTRLPGHPFHPGSRLRQFPDPLHVQR